MFYLTLKVKNEEEEFNTGTLALLEERILNIVCSHIF